MGTLQRSKFWDDEKGAYDIWECLKIQSITFWH